MSTSVRFSSISKRKGDKTKPWEDLKLDDRDLASLPRAKLYELGDEDLLCLELGKAGLLVRFKSGIHEDLYKVHT